MIRIDGAAGEGGGQTLRTALSLSLVTGQAFRIENIRAKREKPGLLRQHLTAVLAAAEVGSAEMVGASLGSKTLEFAPGKIRPGNYQFAVGTAGSSTLVFQTILPALMTASGPSQITLEGGTHNMQAPPFDFLQKTFLPLLARMGPRVSVTLERYGFYPAGGGRFVAEIEPSERLASLVLTVRGPVTERRAVAIVANLPRNIAQRELDMVAHHLNWPADALEILETRESPGPGNVVIIEIGEGTFKEVFTGFGRLGTSAEKVASEAAGEAQAYLASSAMADEHLADQLLLPLALAGGGVFTATKLSLHARTNMEVISLFVGVKFEARKMGDAIQLEVKPGAQMNGTGNQLSRTVAHLRERG
jgi:RNA 3'-terminal phosphate cyclase (ATP)